MKKILLILLFIPLVSFGQLQIEKPDGWIENSPRLLLKLSEENFNKEQYNLIKSDKEDKEAIPYKYFTKYDIKEAKPNKLIPSVFVLFAKNIYQYDIEGIKKSISQPEVEEFYKKVGYVNYKLNYSKITYINKDYNLKAVEVSRTYDVFDKSVRNLSYYFMYNESLFIQMTFIDNSKDNCEEVFKELLKSIKID